MNWRSNHMSNLVSDNSIEDRIKELKAKPISPSERAIVSSFENYLQRKGSLTTKQYDLLLSIQNRYSDANIKKTSDWIASFDDEKRDRLRLAVEYYDNTHYFSDLIHLIKNNPNHIPTEKQYNSMCHNKYFDNALKNYFSDPAFELGDLVVFRNTNRNYHRDKEIIGLIEDITEKRSFEKGGRMYTMMVLGTEDNYKVCEADIKMYREKKNNV